MNPQTVIHTAEWRLKLASTSRIPQLTVESASLEIQYLNSSIRFLAQHGRLIARVLICATMLRLYAGLLIGVAAACAVALGAFVYHKQPSQIRPLLIVSTDETPSSLLITSGGLCFRRVLTTNCWRRHSNGSLSYISPDNQVVTIAWADLESSAARDNRARWQRDYESSIVFSYGWPLAAMYGGYTRIGGFTGRTEVIGVNGRWLASSTISIDSPPLPLNINWAGLLVDSVLLGIAAAILSHLSLTSRRLYRSYKNLCPDCGYSQRGLSSSSVCPECGHDEMACHSSSSD